MTKGLFRTITALVFIFTALCIGALVLFPVPWNAKKNQVEQQARIVIPRNFSTQTEEMESWDEIVVREASMSAKIPLDEGEVIVHVLNGNFNGNPVEEQFVAYRNLLEMESPIYLTFIHFDMASRSYRRLWSAPTAATRPGTIRLHTQDILGDRSICLLLSGMNGPGEHTLTIFRMNYGRMPNAQLDAGGYNYFDKIAELMIDGSITVRETERPQAYQMGFGRGQSFTIAASGRDFESSNILDQIEIIYSYNPGNGLFEQSSRTRIPGTQVEQRRVRELLGNSRAFEDFTTGLWYHITPQGTIDRHRYIFFDPSSREIIFFGDGTQQIFIWRNSTATRLGLYISSQNISVTSLRRAIDIELTSLDSVRLRVIEDVRLKIGVNAPWDGSYRKAAMPGTGVHIHPAAAEAFIDARYNSPAGQIRFFPNGSYEFNAGETFRQGRYTFFSLSGEKFLELRTAGIGSTEINSEGISGSFRETYLVQSEPERSPTGSISLSRVRIGARGVERLHERAVSLALVE